MLGIENSFNNFISNVIIFILKFNIFAPVPIKKSSAVWQVVILGNNFTRFAVIPVIQTPRYGKHFSGRNTYIRAVYKCFYLKSVRHNEVSVKRYVLFQVHHYRWYTLENGLGMQSAK